ncbi:MAG: histidinol dehydrogenase [Spirochaetia bacterium]|jgi:histidinol dehydrogenase|nr:histidinol dehydrogenase [Spirochaetia bacterium]
MIRINFWKWDNLPPADRERILSRSDTDINGVLESVGRIIEEVKANKDSALIEYTKQFDKVDLSKIPLRVKEKEYDEAEKALPAAIKEALSYSIANVREYHRRQLPEGIESFEIRPGIFAGERVSPIDSAALYVPRGRGSFPSMLYMLCVPAVEAGVKRVCVATPPDSDGKVDPASLYAARLCGINEIYRVGGAQVIAALAYGTESIKPVVKITGPGSVYVTAAKRLLYGKIDVGLPAGPSESVILADSEADPYRAALDLLIEAEHGSDSSAVLITDSDELAQKVSKYLSSIIEKVPRPRKTFLSDVFKGYGGIILTSDMAEAAGIVNIYAPEHLQIATKNPSEDAKLIRNAGEILLGQDTPFSIANYSAGPNAVLPTGGMAKSFSPVSVRDFTKSTSLISADKNGLEAISPHVIALADYEGFNTHAGALRMRNKTL